MSIRPSGSWLYRASNSLWIYGGAAGENYGLGPYQHYVDFDLLGPTFHILFGGQLGSTGISAPGFHWYVRIGGHVATDPLVPPTPILDGDRVLIGITGAIAAFGNWVLDSGPITNIWSGSKLVKLTSDGASSLRPTLGLFPVL
jgi:hypothetical protein